MKPTKYDADGKPDNGEEKNTGLGQGEDKCSVREEAHDQDEAKAGGGEAGA